MLSRWPWLWVVVVAACGASPAPAVPPVARAPEDPTAQLLREVKEASGGARWDGVRTLHAEGTAIDDGVKGTFTLDEDLTDGRFALRAAHGVFVIGEGFDGQKRWRADASGEPHALDTDEARAIQRTESYLARRGYLFPERTAAQYRRLPAVEENGRTWDTLEARIEGGRPVTLRIDRKTHLVDRASFFLSFYPRVVQYADYRLVEGLKLPFAITVENDEALVPSAYRVAAAPGDYAVPPPVQDVRMTGAAVEVPMHLHANGRFVIDVVVDGQPLSFLLDTGGHAILTPEAAAKLGLATVGGGITYGSGEGSTPTKYTRAKSLRLGTVEIADPPFLVMPFGYAFCERGNKTPLAGLLGLELFDRFVVEVDYDREVLTLRPFGSAPAPRGTPVPLQFTLDMPMVPAQLDGHDGMFGLDTGNSGDVVVFREWAAAAGIADRYRAGLPMISSGAGGDSVNYLARAERFAIGGHQLGELRARLAEDKGGAFAAVGEAGNIGQAALSRFNLTFDYRQQRMYLEHRKSPKIWPAARSGFGAMKVANGTFVVSTIVKGGPAEAVGLREKDVLLAIDGVATARVTGDDLFAKLRQSPGTKLRVTAEREGHKDERVVVLRELVP